VEALTALEAYGKRAKPRGAVVAVEALELPAEAGVVDRAAEVELLAALEEDPGQVSAEVAAREAVRVAEVQAGAAVVPGEAAAEPSPGNG
jgi:hypothetical protein